MNTIKKFIALMYILSISSSYGANPPVNHSGTKTTSVSIAGLSTQAQTLKTNMDAKIAQYASQITIDTSAVEQFVRDAAIGLNWTVQRLADETATLISDAGTKLQAELPGLISDLGSDITTALAAVVSTLDPKAKFQADYSYDDTDYSSCSWSAGACNLEGAVTGLALKGEATIIFNAGISAIATATTQFKINVKVNGSLSMDGFNPVRPTSGSGSSITITATPKWKTVTGGSLGTTALLGLTIGADVTGNGTLADVSGTLTVP